MTDRIKILETFIAEDPADDFSTYALALEYNKAGSPVKSQSLLTGLLARNPDYLPAYYQLAGILLRKNGREEAVKIIESGIMLAKKKNDSHTENELRALLETEDETEF